jgi:D-alanine-D-alanine ligase
MMQLKRKHRIAVLMGGISNEREISFKSGKAVTKALKKLGHNAIPVDVTGKSLDQLDAIKPEVAFIALHGEFGEDGGVQQILDEKDIPYVGSDARASRLGMNKTASKHAFIQNAVPTPDYLLVDDPTDLGTVTKQAGELGYPMVCKPVEGGSSIGVEIVRSSQELKQAIRRSTVDHISKNAGQPAAKENCKLILERYIPGREFTVGILDGKALPVVEIRSERPFFDYKAKYYDSNTEYTVPVPSLGRTYGEITEVGIRAYNALGCRHIGRADILYGHDGHIYVLEVNTIPGLTSRSLVPMAAKQAGVDFPELCERLCYMALRDAGSAGYDSRVYRRFTA